MKNAIAYYYNLYSYDIHQSKDIYRFTINNIHYVLSPCEKNEIKNMYEMTIKLRENGIPIHDIIPNTMNEIYTRINNVDYVLMKINDISTRKIQLLDIINFSRNVSRIQLDTSKKQDWALLWSNKIDYFEYQVNQFGKKYPLIRESFGYYAGLAEIGISLYKTSKIDFTNQIICHKRINTNSTIYDLYNPLNLVVDYRVRDSSEYFKDLFSIKEDIFNDIINYFQIEYLTVYECYIFFVRMFYPSFYFDTYERIMEGACEEEKLNNIVFKSIKYEQLLKKIYNYLSYNINIPDIEWLKKHEY